MSQSASQPEYALAQRDKTSYPWYIPDIAKYLTPSTERLLSEYSHVPVHEQSAHIHDIRDKAFAIRSYPCTGLGVFLVPFITHTPIYATILSKLKDGATFLDVGCFMGSDLRQLAFDGAPTDHMVGVDIVSHWEMGFQMYRDREKFRAQFIEADIVSAHERLLALRGQVEIIEISAVLHQFDLQTQVTLCKTLVSFSKQGTLLFGYQIGAEPAHADEQGGQNVFWQSPESFANLLKRTGVETGTDWEVRCEFLDWEILGWDIADMGWLAGKRPISFVAERTNRYNPIGSAPRIVVSKIGGSLVRSTLKSKTSDR